MESIPEKSVEVTQFNVLSSKPLTGPLPIMGLRPVAVHTAKDARRLLSRLIIGLQKREIVGQECKDLVYVLTAFLNGCKMVEIENRLSSLEKGTV